MRSALAAVVLVAACTMAPPGPDYSHVRGWQVSSLVAGQGAVGAHEVEVREFSLDREAGRMALTVKGCNTLRVHWLLVEDRDNEANLRVDEAVSSTDCTGSAAVDEALREVLRSADSARFRFERIEIGGPAGRLALEPR